MAILHHISQDSISLLKKLLCSRTHVAGNVYYLLHLRYGPGLPIAMCVFGQVSICVLPLSLIGLWDIGKII